MFAFLTFRKKTLARRLGIWNGTAHDQDAWQAWLGAKTRRWNEVVELIEDETAAKCVRVRALAAALLWDEKYDPFDGRRQTAFSGSLYDCAERLDHVPLDLASAAAIIVGFCLEALDAGAPEREPYIRERYNRRIPVLLSQALDPGLDERLYRLFHFRDDQPPSQGMEETTGYGPFETAFMSAEVLDDVKRRLDAEMRRRIAREHAGVTFPRAWYEAGDRWYILTAFSLMTDDGPVPRDLFEEMLGFVLSWQEWSPAVTVLLRHYLIAYWEELQPITPGSAYRPLIRRALLCGDERTAFRIRDRSDLRFAGLCLSHFCDDGEIVKVLGPMVVEALPHYTELQPTSP